MKPAKRCRIYDQHSSILLREEEGDHLGEFEQEMALVAKENLSDWMERLTDFLHQNNNISSIGNCWKNIHGFLVLNLGNAFLEKKISVIFIRCLKALYSHISPSIFPIEELERVIYLLSSQEQDVRKITFDESDNESVYSLWMTNCLDVLRILLLQLPMKIQAPSNLYLLLVKLASSITHNENSSTIKSQSKQMIVDLNREHEDSLEHSRIAILALRSIETEEIAEWTSAAMKDNEVVLYFRYLTQSSIGVKILLKNAVAICYRLRGVILENKEKRSKADEKIRILAIECLARMSEADEQLSNSVQDVQCHFRVIMDILVDIWFQNNVSLQEKEVVVSGLKCCIVQKGLMQADSRARQLMNSMLNVAMNKEINPNIRHSAASIILHIIFSMSRNSLKEDRDAYFFISELLLRLLRSDLDDIIHLAVHAIFQMFHSKTNNQLLLHYTSILDELANIASRPYNGESTSSHRTRCLILRIMRHYADKDQLFLARQHKVVQSIVSIVALRSPSHAIASATDINENKEQQRLAFAILLQLSEQVSNRRVLVKQVGFLASMIQFARAMSPEDEQSVIKKKDLKRVMLQLAQAL